MDYTDNNISPAHPQMLTSQQLIEHMKKKGITFQYTSEEEALAFLQEKNYYFKLTSYRKNYARIPSGGNTGKYIDLDFAYLQELSYIDMELRYVIMHMCLDIEHYLKVDLLQSIENNPKEDGYYIVNLFLASRPTILEKLEPHNKSSYSKYLIQKFISDNTPAKTPEIYDYHIPIWAFIELISFGDFSALYAKYHDEYHIKIAGRVFLNAVRDLRNACAHNNCLINNLRKDPDHEIYGRIGNEIKRLNVMGETARSNKLKNPFLEDFACLLFTYHDVVTDISRREEAFQKLIDLFENPNGVMLRHADWFKGNTLLKSSYDFCKNILDGLAS